MNIRPLLDLIGSLEAPLGYNQLYGKNITAPLTTMSLREVQALQVRMLKQGSPSSAVGRYQILKNTLRDCMKLLELSEDSLFDSSMQDALACYLMEQKGLKRWDRGQISDETFGNNLAKIWASLPVITGPKKGRSYYQGDGLNKSLCTPEQVLAVLKESKHAV